MWHTGLTKELSQAIENQQKTALKIIKPDLDYPEACELLKIEKLETRRDNLCRKFYQNMQKPTHKVHGLLPRFKTHRYETSQAHHRIVPN